MAHLRPIIRDQADIHIQSLYDEVASTLSVEAVPLFFQYLANFPDFFTYVWGKSALNLRSNVFPAMADQMSDIATKAILEVYKPSQTANSFISAISAHERAYLHETAVSVMVLNAKLLVLTIGIRESIKGVFIGQKRIEGHDKRKQDEIGEDVASFLFKPYSLRDVSKLKESTITSSSSFLAPLFSSGIAISSLPHFFSHIDHEMHRLLKTEKYLEKRVFLEQQAMQASYRLPHPLGASYQELIRLAGGKPHFHELLSLLVETFPTAYPRMLFTTAVMQAVLADKQDQASAVLS